MYYNIYYACFIHTVLSMVQFSVSIMMKNWRLEIECEQQMDAMNGRYIIYIASGAILCKYTTNI